MDKAEDKQWVKQFSKEQIPGIVTPAKKRLKKRLGKEEAKEEEYDYFLDAHQDENQNENKGYHIIDQGDLVKEEDEEEEEP